MDILDRMVESCWVFGLTSLFGPRDCLETMTTTTTASLAMSIEAKHSCLTIDHLWSFDHENMHSGRRQLFLPRPFVRRPRRGLRRMTHVVKRQERKHYQHVDQVACKIGKVSTRGRESSNADEWSGTYL